MNKYEVIKSLNVLRDAGILKKIPTVEKVPGEVQIAIREKCNDPEFNIDGNFYFLVNPMVFGIEA